MSEPDADGRVKIMTLHLPLPLTVFGVIGRHLGAMYDTCVLKSVADEQHARSLGWRGPARTTKTSRSPRAGRATG